MSPHATEVLKQFVALDGLLVRAGFPPTSPWWKKQVRRFYASGRRRWVIRAGRRAGKSSTLCRLAYVEARWGGHKIPPGDTGFVMFVSRDRDEAAQRLRTIQAIADAVGDKLEARGDSLLFPARRTGFKVYTASIAGVSGPTAILVVGDEVAKWKDSDTGVNPATDVIASAMPTLATQPEARAIWSSSPMGTLDAHFTMFDQGNTKHQLVSCGATWDCNPSVTEDQTHELEPDDRIWRREYKAEPQANALGAFDEDAIDRAIGRDVGDVTGAGEPVLVIDPSSGRSDAFTWATAQWLTDGHKWRLRLSQMNGVEGRFFEQLHSDDLVRKICAQLAPGTRIHSDQREAYTLSALFKAQGMRFYSHDWTGPKKQTAIELLRRWLADDVLILDRHDKLRKQLVSFQERITANGSFTFGGRGTTKDDYVALLITAAMASIDRGIKRPSPPAARRGYIGGVGESPHALDLPGTYRMPGEEDPGAFLNAQTEAHNFMLNHLNQQYANQLWSGPR